MDETIRIPLHRKDGAVKAYALVDLEDAALAQFRWGLDSKGYVTRTVRPGDGTRHKQSLHRAVLGLDRDDPRQGDHINRDKLDNRRANLRPVTTAQNCQNLGSASRGKSSRYRGVSWHAHTQRWLARAAIEGRLYYLGLFGSEEVAAAVAKAFRAEHMPFSYEDA